mgnify:CR=1 FL=1
MSNNGPLRIGIGGPVGAGKTTLTASLIRILHPHNSVGVITNDIYTQEDAEALMRMQILPKDRVIGVETGGCPHTAIREDASINLAAVAEMRQRYDDIEIIFIESGGDNVTTTFSPALADYTIYIVDVSGGDKYPRKGGLGIETSDLLVINKIDLAPSIGADLNVMERDAKIVRKNKPYVLVNCKTDQGVEQVAQHIIHDVLFDEPPKNMITQVKS